MPQNPVQVGCGYFAHACYSRVQGTLSELARRAAMEPGTSQAWQDDALLLARNMFPSAYARVAEARIDSRGNPSWCARPWPLTAADAVS